MILKQILKKQYKGVYDYEILAFDRQVAGSSPTVGVWSPKQRKKGIATIFLQRVVVSIQVVPISWVAGVCQTPGW